LLEPAATPDSTSSFRLVMEDDKLMGAPKNELEIETAQLIGLS
jgi:hypothetical protein